MRVLASLVAVFALASCGSQAAPPLARSLVLITLDTTRADALGSLGAPAGLTPRLDAFAAAGIVFENARTVAPLTLPAHASMLTGLYPPRHTLRTNALNALPAEASTLAERAQAAGIETAAFVGAAVLDRRFGLDQGFETYDGPSFPDVQDFASETERPASDVVAAAAQWLAARDGERPYFLWVHVFDPHSPYEPTPAASARVAALDVPRERRPYLAEVAEVDAQIGALLDAIEQHSAAGPPLVVLTADHGESLGQHDEATHAALCFDTTIRVPLIVRLPAGQRAGERSSDPVSVVDVFATAVDALGLGRPGDIDGQSLLAAAPERGVYFESYDGFIAYDWSPLAGWADADGKYLHSSQPLFFRPDDPDELAPQVASPSDAAYERYRRALAAVAARPTLTEAVAAGDGQTRSQLEALGYTGVYQSSSTLPHPLEPGDRPTPMERTADIRLLQAGAQLFNTGMAENDADALVRATQLLGQLAERNPGNEQAKEKLALAFGRLGKDVEAAEVYEVLLRDHPPQAGRINNLAVCYFNLGRTEEAVVQAQRSLALDPANEKALGLLVHFQTALGNAADAARYAKQLQQLRQNP